MTSSSGWQAFLESISTDVIHFPISAQAKVAASAKFEKISGFTHVLGCVDGTYITYMDTRGPHIEFHPRIRTDTRRSPVACKQFVILIASSLMSFLGHTGRTPDAQAFRRSFVFNDLPQICEGDKYRVVGDAAYPLREYPLNLFRNYG
ncbi:hypothetical protein IscW_ISCW024714 [Ixodes scapularis]|uniref:Uncharacterized protein n=1 Tax=Ixodes scapularis TaxID=6945 RepID=B7Q4K0_IXOSC|nr:hypothetical protein IscW_ISCW024714 [Ixodes scapularis]|eukprot:XP_002411556.1 hypothetical protein IscW_ISCW024714 [Ixodes scapularis]